VLGVGDVVSLDAEDPAAGRAEGDRVSVGQTPPSGSFLPVPLR
jgi:hypothetical protein